MKKRAVATLATTLAVGLVAALGAASCTSTQASPEQRCTDQILGVYDKILDANSFGAAVAIAERYGDSDLDSDAPAQERFARLDECKGLSEASLKKIEKKTTNSSKGHAVEDHVNDLVAKAFEDALTGEP